jgi:hypothetical protein
MPMAKGDTGIPAEARGMSRSWAMEGSTPERMNSEVPWAKMPSPRTWLC